MAASANVKRTATKTSKAANNPSAGRDEAHSAGSTLPIAAAAADLAATTKSVGDVPAANSILTIGERLADDVSEEATTYNYYY